MKEARIEDLSSDFEEQRVLSLLEYNILDSEVEQDFEEITHLASLICGEPISLISLIDKDRQWFKSHYGLDITQTDRCYSFCQFTILTTELFEVEDALQDPRFVANPLVKEFPFIRHYCGAPLTTPDGFRLGALCVIDRVPRKLTTFQKEALIILAKQVVTHFEVRKQKFLLSKEKGKLEQKVLERTHELQEANKELNTFIYKASHDLRGPLATILGLTTLGNSTSAEEESIFCFDRIAQTSIKLDKILKNLSKVVQLKDHNFELVHLSGDAIREQIVDIFRNFKEISFDYEISVSPATAIFTDSILLNTILENIIDNAITYRKDFEKLIIKVIVEQEKETTRISIEDNGEGIEEDSFPKLCNMFYRANNKSKGSGLGLFIVKKAVSLLKGEINFNSKLHKGSVFSVVLPKL